MSGRCHSPWRTPWLVLLLLLLSAQQAVATHFRFMSITWSTDIENRVTFEQRHAWRYSFGSLSSSVWQTLKNMGGGRENCNIQHTPPTAKVSRYNLNIDGRSSTSRNDCLASSDPYAEDWWLALATHVNENYVGSTSGSDIVRLAYHSGCCRVSNLRANQADDSWRVEATYMVRSTTRNRNSPVPSVLPITVLFRQFNGNAIDEGRAEECGDINFKSTCNGKSYCRWVDDVFRAYNGKIGACDIDYNDVQDRQESVIEFLIPATDGDGDFLACRKSTAGEAAYSDITFVSVENRFITTEPYTQCWAKFRERDSGTPSSSKMRTLGLYALSVRFFDHQVLDQAALRNRLATLNGQSFVVRYGERTSTSSRQLAQDVAGSSGPYAKLVSDGLIRQHQGTYSNRRTVTYTMVDFIILLKVRGKFSPRLLFNGSSGGGNTTPLGSINGLWGQEIVINMDAWAGVPGLHHMANTIEIVSTGYPYGAAFVSLGQTANNPDTAVSNDPIYRYKFAWTPSWGQIGTSVCVSVKALSTNSIAISSESYCWSLIVSEPDVVYLSGILRDFSQHHPDFAVAPSSGITTGLVQSVLSGADPVDGQRKPVLASGSTEAKQLFRHWFLTTSDKGCVDTGASFSGNQFAGTYNSPMALCGEGRYDTQDACLVGGCCWSSRVSRCFFPNDMGTSGNAWLQPKNLNRNKIYSITFSGQLPNPIFTYSSSLWYPVNNELLGNERDTSNQYKEVNSYFTFEMHTFLLFNTTSPDPAVTNEVYDRLEYAASGDLWVFLDGELVVDLGGNHQKLGTKKALDMADYDTGCNPASPSCHDKAKDEAYALDLYYAHRHTGHPGIVWDASSRAFCDALETGDAMMSQFASSQWTAQNTQFLNGNEVLMGVDTSRGGYVWSKQRHRLLNGFRATFDFDIRGSSGNPYQGRERGFGFAFVVQGQSDTVFGDDKSGSMGYQDLRGAVAVEFDTHRDEYLSDPAEEVPNHISVHVSPDSQTAVTAHENGALGPAKYPVKNDGVTPDIENYDMSRGKLVDTGTISYERLQVRVEYTPKPAQISVFLGDIVAPVYVALFEGNNTLANHIGDAGLAHIGFTMGSRSGSAQQVSLKNFEFKTVQANGGQSIIQNPSVAALADVRARFTVLARDLCGEEITIPGVVDTASFSTKAWLCQSGDCDDLVSRWDFVAKDGIDITVTPLTDGRYSVVLPFVVEGLYLVQGLLSGDQMTGSPFEVLVSPGTISADFTRLGNAVYQDEASLTLTPMIVGQTINLEVHARDAYFNDVNSADTDELYLLHGGKRVEHEALTFAYNHTTKGTYKLSIRVRDQKIRKAVCSDTASVDWRPQGMCVDNLPSAWFDNNPIGSPVEYSLRLLSGPVDVSTSSAIGPDTTINVNDPYTFKIYLSDEYGNLVDYDVANSHINSLSYTFKVGTKSISSFAPPSCSVVNTDEIECTFMTTKAGRVELNVEYNNAPLATSQLVFTVLPGPISPPHCTFEFDVRDEGNVPITQLDNGDGKRVYMASNLTHNRFIVQLRDEYDNKLTAGTVTGSNLLVPGTTSETFSTLNLNNGQLIVSVDPYVLASTELTFQLDVGQGMQNIHGGSVLRYTMVPNSPDPVKTTASMAASSLLLGTSVPFAVGENMKFVVVVRDRNGNLRVGYDDSAVLQAFVPSGNCVFNDVTSLGNSEYEISFFCRASGTFTGQVLVSGVEAEQFSSMVVSPGAISPSVSSSTKTLTVQSDDITTVQVTARDAYGNLVFYGADPGDYPTDEIKIGLQWSILDGSTEGSSWMNCGRATSCTPSSTVACAFDCSFNATEANASRFDFKIVTAYLPGTSTPLPKDITSGNAAVIDMWEAQLTSESKRRPSIGYVDWRKAGGSYGLGPITLQAGESIEYRVHDFLYDDEPSSPCNINSIDFSDPANDYGVAADCKVVACPATPAGNGEFADTCHGSNARSFALSLTVNNDETIDPKDVVLPTPTFDNSDTSSSDKNTYHLTQPVQLTRSGTFYLRAVSSYEYVLLYPERVAGDEPCNYLKTEWCSNVQATDCAGTNSKLNGLCTDTSNAMTVTVEPGVLDPRETAATVQWPTGYSSSNRLEAGVPVQFSWFAKDSYGNEITATDYTSAFSVVGCTGGSIARVGSTAEYQMTGCTSELANADNIVPATGALQIVLTVTFGGSSEVVSHNIIVKPSDVDTSKTVFTAPRYDLEVGAQHLIDAQLFDRFNNRIYLASRHTEVAAWKLAVDGTPWNPVSYAVRTDDDSLLRFTMNVAGVTYNVDKALSIDGGSDATAPIRVLSGAVGSVGCIDIETPRGAQGCTGARNLVAGETLTMTLTFFDAVGNAINPLHDCMENGAVVSCQYIIDQRSVTWKSRIALRNAYELDRTYSNNVVIPFTTRLYDPRSSPRIDASESSDITVDGAGGYTVEVQVFAGKIDSVNVVPTQKRFEATEVADDGTRVEVQVMDEYGNVRANDDVRLVLIMLDESALESQASEHFEGLNVTAADDLYYYDLTEFDDGTAFTLATDGPIVSTSTQGSGTAFANVFKVRSRLAHAAALNVLVKPCSGPSQECYDSQTAHDSQANYIDETGELHAHPNVGHLMVVSPKDMDHVDNYLPSGDFSRAAGDEIVIEFKAYDSFGNKLQSLLDAREQSVRLTEAEIEQVSAPGEFQVSPSNLTLSLVASTYQVRLQLTRVGQYDFNNLRFKKTLEQLPHTITIVAADLHYAFPLVSCDIPSGQCAFDAQLTEEGCPTDSTMGSSCTGPNVPLNGAEPSYDGKTAAYFGSVFAGRDAGFALTGRDKYGNEVTDRSFAYVVTATRLSEPRATFEAVFNVTDGDVLPSPPTAVRPASFFPIWPGTYSIDSVSIHCPRIENMLHQGDVTPCPGSFKTWFNMTITVKGDTCGLDSPLTPYRCPSGDCAAKCTDCAGLTPAQCENDATPICGAGTSMCSTTGACVPTGSCPPPKANCPAGYAACPNAKDQCRRADRLNTDCPAVHVCPPAMSLCQDGFSCVYNTATSNCTAIDQQWDDLMQNATDNGLFVCADATLVRNAGECPTPVTCQEGAMLCADGTCVTSRDQCVEVPSCQDARLPYKCPSGECRASVFDCGTSRTCPVGWVKCPNQACAPSVSECMSIDPVSGEPLDNNELQENCTVSGGDLTYVRCPDGSCAAATTLCSSPLTCPVGMIRCADNTCVESLSDCAAPLVCGAGQVTCPGGECMPTESSCPTSTGCLPDAPVLCGDGMCRQSVEECSSPSKCPASQPFRCPDGNCAATASLCTPGRTCDIVLTPLKCPTGTCVIDPTDCPSTSQIDDYCEGKLRCPSGTCVDNMSQCPTPVQCPAGLTLAYDNSCRPSSTQVLATCEEMFGDGYVRCPDGVSCVQSLSDCPTEVSCPESLPIKCRDGLCRATVADCPSFSEPGVDVECESSSTTLVRCGDGTCGDFIPANLTSGAPPSTTCSTGVTCPTQSPFLCWDRTCRTRAADCPVAPVCPDSAPLLCPTGQCVSKRRTCPHPITCPIDKPVLCGADWLCKASRAECDAAYDEKQGDINRGCPGDEATQCADGSCRPDANLCEPSVCSFDDGRGIQCSDGRCVSRRDLCFGESCQMADGNFGERCSDGSCKSSLDKCFDGKDAQTCYVNGQLDSRRCDDGSCPFEGDMSTCPEADNLGCTGECNVPYRMAALEAADGGQRVCDTRCGNGLCAQSASSKGIECAMLPDCPVSAPFKCWNGLCVESSAYCPSSSASSDLGMSQQCTDPKNPVACADGVCRASSEECTSIKPVCFEGEMRCGDGLCHQCRECNPLMNTQDCVYGFTTSDGKDIYCRDLCPASSCPAGMSMCRNTDPCGGSIQQVDSSSFECSSSATRTLVMDGMCVADESLCLVLSSSDSTLSPGCPVARPQRCDNGLCVAAGDSCATSQEVSCPSSLPHRCASSGLCVSEAGKCQTKEGCPAAFPVLCANGACVARDAGCDAQTGDLCQAKERCASGMCPQTLTNLTAEYPSDVKLTPSGGLTDCKVTNGCPVTAPFLCGDGVCKASASKCAVVTQTCDPHSYLNVHCADGSCVASPEDCTTVVKPTDGTKTGSSYVHCVVVDDNGDATSKCIAASDTCSASATAVTPCEADTKTRCLTGYKECQVTSGTVEVSQCIPLGDTCDASLLPSTGGDDGDSSGPVATCPVTAPTQCASGECVSSIVECENSGTSNGDSGVDDLDGSGSGSGSGSIGSDDFVPNGCPVAAPVKCFDGYCAASSAVCVERTENAVPSSECPLKCSDGSCVEDLRQCAPVSACRSGQWRCNDGTCVAATSSSEANAKCPNNNQAPSCPAEKPACVYDGVCRSEVQCLQLSSFGCFGEKPFQCRSGLCVTSASECDDSSVLNTRDDDGVVARTSTRRWQRYLTAAKFTQTVSTSQSSQFPLAHYAGRDTLVLSVPSGMFQSSKPAEALEIAPVPLSQLRDFKIIVDKSRVSQVTGDPNADNDNWVEVKSDFGAQVLGFDASVLSTPFLCRASAQMGYSDNDVRAAATLRAVVDLDVPVGKYGFQSQRVLRDGVWQIVDGTTLIKASDTCLARRRIESRRWECLTTVDTNEVIRPSVVSSAVLSGTNAAGWVGTAVLEAPLYECAQAGAIQDSVFAIVVDPQRIDLNETEDRSWLSRNWGWVLVFVLGGFTVAMVLVYMIVRYSRYRNKYKQSQEEFEDAQAELEEVAENDELGFQDYGAGEVGAHVSVNPLSKASAEAGDDVAAIAHEKIKIREEMQREQEEQRIAQQQVEMASGGAFAFDNEDFKPQM
ncbi:MAG: hypothetical protein MHM6MM_003119 [Cercozoa sp. M6MM]